MTSAWNEKWRKFNFFQLGRDKDLSAPLYYFTFSVSLFQKTVVIMPFNTPLLTASYTCLYTDYSEVIFPTHCFSLSTIAAVKTTLLQCCSNRKVLALGSIQILCYELRVAVVTVCSEFGTFYITLTTALPMQR